MQVVKPLFASRAPGGYGLACWTGSARSYTHKLAQAVAPLGIAWLWPLHSGALFRAVPQSGQQLVFLTQHACPINAVALSSVLHCQSEAPEHNSFLCPIFEFLNPVHCFCLGATLVVFRAESWLCTQRSVLVGLGLTVCT